MLVFYVQPDLVHTGDDDISKDISRLEAKHHQQVEVYFDF